MACEINVSLAAPEEINVEFTSIDLTNWDHSTLGNLDYDSAGHTDFVGISAEQTLTNKTIEDLKIINKLYLDFDSDTYLKYNSSTQEIELYVGGNIRASW